jgi:hypothetical protein
MGYPRSKQVGGTSWHMSGGTHPFSTRKDGLRDEVSVEDKKPEQGGGTPSCAQRWGVGHRTQDPSRDRGWGLDPRSWGVYPKSASGGCHPIVVGRFLKIDRVPGKKSEVNGFEGGG